MIRCQNLKKEAQPTSTTKKQFIINYELTGQTKFSSQYPLASLALHPYISGNNSQESAISFRLPVISCPGSFITTGKWSLTAWNCNFKEN